MLTSFFKQLPQVVQTSARVVAQMLNARFFEIITFKVGALLLLVSNIFLPLGQHRLWMGIRGWWLFPLTFILTAFGLLKFMQTHTSVWALTAFPYSILYVLDFWLVVALPMPAGKSPSTPSLQNKQRIKS